MTSRRTTVTIAVLTALVYSSWVLGPWLNPDLDSINAFASELGADGQPFARVFRLADVVAALGFIAVAWLAYPRLSPRSIPRSRAAWFNALPHLVWLSVFLFAGATILDATFSMPCAESQVPHSVAISPQCRTTSMLVHETASILVGVGTIAATVLSTWMFFAHQLPNRFAIATTAASHIALTAYTGIDSFLHWPGKGLSQRGAMVALVLWWVIYVVSVVKPSAKQGERA